jgi:hypothetical protein
MVFRPPQRGRHRRGGLADHGPRRRKSRRDDGERTPGLRTQSGSENVNLSKSLTGFNCIDKETSWQDVVLSLSER